MSRDRDAEAIDYFRTHFGPVNNAVYLESEALGGVPDFLGLFWKEVGCGSRSDEFLWLLDPREFGWLPRLFQLDEQLIPFARTSFGDFHLFDRDGMCYAFSPHYQTLNPMSPSFHTAVMSLSESDYVDDDPLFTRHQEAMRQGLRINASSSFCLTPAIPLGGDEESSDIYVGETHAYLTFLSRSS